MDYHIYIHSVGDGTSPTKPKKPRADKPTKPKIQKKDDDENGLVPLLSGISFVAVAKVVASATNAVSSFMSRETGNYVFSRQFNNAWNNLKVLMNPIGTTISYFNMEQQMRLSSQRAAESRVLFGDSYVNKGIRRV